MTSSVPALTRDDRQSVAQFRENITSLLTQLKTELEQSKRIKDEAQAFNERGFISRWTGALTTQNDKDLAQMIAGLGGSLRITQEVVQCLLQIQSQKNQALKGFHGALVDKIEELSSNDTVLDLNIRGNLSLILGHLKEQVEEKLEQAERVEQQALQLQEQAENLERLGDRISAEKRDRSRLAEQQADLEEFTERLGEKNRLVEEEVAALRLQVSHLEQAAKSGQQQQEALRNALQENEEKMNLSLQLQEDKNAFLSRTMRKNRLDFRDALLFLTSAAVVALLWIQFGK
ncbi:hypothetical protein [Pantoea sp. BAV 3049]|uniref:hypothetical protein n=1 Tax=Pantoea sp. BAV 3049 TaxID=2654188 RepID=UPI00131DE0FD|nr:hypothetical protein [Pantoea sp. BAV 3049]